MAKLFEGSGVALVTPFYKTKKGNLKVDYDALKDLVKYHKRNNTDAIIICGTTGEASTLTDKEHIKTIKKCVEYANGKIPVIAGTGSNDTRHAVYLAKQAEDVGVDGLLCVTPYYNKTNQEGLKLYYKRISDAVDIPVIMYNVPSRTGVNILPETAIEIAKKNKNVVAIKEASGNIEQVKEIASSKALDIYSGNDDQIFDVMDAGGIGVISVLANVFPNQTHRIIEEYQKGNKEESLRMQKEALELVKALFSDVNPIPVKKAVESIGLCEGYVREPLVELDYKKTQRLLFEMEDYRNKNRN
ncbi:MAG: 4-hydroxy-tetrahydrodipicolinate synthase [Bacilli bacterium]|nr:4-hydroxy-tetrahydrodipicolinate synthase [Bacilli bacterium]